ncbi:MAG: putative ABC transporter C family member 2, partial [Streblomastix strix]
MTSQQTQIASSELEQKHSYFYYLLYCFFFPLICREQPLTDSDICEIQTRDKYDVTTKCIEKSWRKRFEEYYQELAEQLQINSTSKDMNKPSKPSLFKILITQLGGIKFFLAFLMFVPSIGFVMVQPVLMKEIMKQIIIKASMQELTKFPYVSVIILILSPVLRAFFDSLACRFIIHFTANIRSALAGLLYKKVLSLNITSQSNINAGRLISFISADLNQIGVSLPYVFQIFLVPVQIFVPFGFVCYYFGIMLIMAPLQMMFTRFFMKYIQSYLMHNDERNKIINETLLGMRAVKLSGLEKIFIEHIEAARKKQLNDIFFQTLWIQMMISTMRVTPSFVNSATIATYIFSKNIPQSLFAVEVQPTSLFLIMESFPFSFLAFQMQDLGAVITSMIRIRDFLILPELVKMDKKLPTNSDLVVEVTDCSFGWGDPPEIPMTSEELEELELEQAKRKQQIMEQKEKIEQNLLQTNLLENSSTQSVSQGSLTMVIGSVGSGKSSLGSVLIGDIELMNNEEQAELKQTKGEVRIDGSIAYCPQTAWINNNTVRGNITFGNKFSKKKYNDVVHVCALEPDFQTLAAGDMTAIGEKGVNLSGGQKARIQLARAVYSDRDIYILDDPLSAVDAHVGKILFEECINGRLKGKTRLLMTNQLQYIDQADNIILLRDKQIFAQGTTANIKNNGISFEEFIIKGSQQSEKEDKSGIKDNKQQESNINDDDKKDKLIDDEKDQIKKEQEENVAKKILTEEEQDTGAVTWGSYFDYLFTLVPKWAIFFYLFSLAIVEIVSSFESWWIGVIGTETRYPTMSYNWKIVIYVLIGVAILLLNYVFVAVQSFSNKRSCRIIHNDLLNHVMKAPNSFFETTPLGRIVNRFSGDIVSNDQQLLMIYNWVIS